MATSLLSEIPPPKSPTSDRQKGRAQTDPEDMATCILSETPPESPARFLQDLADYVD